MPGGNYLAAGIEHSEHGDPTVNGVVHARMNEKRFKKLDPIMHRKDLFIFEGNPSAPLALLSWGSSAGVCREALARATSEGLDCKLLIPYLVYPVAEAIYAEFFASVTAGVFVELSHQGQLYRILRMFVDVPKGMTTFLRDGANPFQPAEIVARLREAAMGLQHARASNRPPAEE